jgi:serine/threonine-protein kinase
LGRIVRRCLEKDAEQRIQSAKDLRNELEDLSRELTASGRRVTRQPAGRMRRLAWPALLAALMLAGGSWLLYDRLGGVPSPTPSPFHLSVEEGRIFPGDRGPDYIRKGVLDTLTGRLSELSGIYVVGSDGPNPDITIQADARRSGETVGLGFRVLDSERNVELGNGALEGESENLFELVERAARSIVHVVGRELDLVVDYRPGKPPTTDAVAFDLFLQASAAAWAEDRPADGEAVHEILQRALSRDPGFARAHLLQGQTYLEQHRAARGPDLAAEAEKHCRTAAELDSALGAAYTCLGETLRLQERTLDAITAYRRALELDTSDLTPHHGLRDAYLDLGLPESAEQDWQRLIRRYPDFWAGYYSLGTYYQDLERYEEALEQYSRALQLAPRNAEVHSYLGTLYFYLGRFEEATVALQESIEIRPTWEAYYNLGGIYYSLRRFDAAVAAFEQAVQISDSDYEPQGRLGWACYWAPGRREEAPTHLRRAITLAQSRLETEPEDSDAWILTALFQAIAGDREPSLESLRRAIDLRPNDPHYFYLAALAANHLGDTDAALDWLQRAVRGGYSTAEIRTIVDFDNLHSDPRFQQLLREAAPNHS